MASLYFSPGEGRGDRSGPHRRAASADGHTPARNGRRPTASTSLAPVAGKGRCLAVKAGGVHVDPPLGNLATREEITCEVALRGPARARDATPPRTAKRTLADQHRIEPLLGRIPGLHRIVWGADPTWWRAGTRETRYALECAKTGATWIHLRTCQACGATLCCDSSPNRHSRANAKTAGHPVFASAEPGERWLYRLADVR